MANIFINLPATTGNGSGAATDVSTMGAVKTIVCGGNAEATINVEVNNAAVATDGSWQTVASFQNRGQLTVRVAARWMRVTTSGYNPFVGGAADVNVGATDGGATFATLVAPAGNGAGASVNVSALGLFKSVQVSGPFRGSVIVEVSEDGNQWGQPFAFTAGGIQSAIIAAEFMRVTRNGVPLVSPGLPIVNVGATDDVSGDDGVAISAGTQSVATGTVVFSNSNGVSFGMSNSSVVTASVDAIKTISAGTATAIGPGISFGNGSGVTFGLTGNTVTASIAPAGAINLAAGTQTANTGTVILSNSNGLSFGMSNSSVVTASMDAFRSMIAGTVTQTGPSLVFSNSNNISFGINAGTLTASVTGATMPDFQNMNGPNGLQNVSNAASLSERPFFVPFYLPASATFGRFNWAMDMAGGASSLSFSATCALYTMVNSTQMSLAGSFSNSYSATNTGSVSGIRVYRMTGVPAGITALTPGPYIMALHFHTLGGTASLNASLRGASTGALSGVIDPGADQQITATSALTAIGSQFCGQYSVTTASLPNAVANTDLFHGLTGGSQGPVIPWFRIERT